MAYASSSDGPAPAKAKGRGRPKLSTEELGRFCTAMAMAPRQLRHAAAVITERFDLGPRGAWIIGLIATGSAYPSDLTRIFGVGRSLITAELVRLEAASLITCTRSGDDARRVELALTPLGRTANDELGDELGALVGDRLAAYTREDILLCMRILHAFTGSAPDARR